MLNNSLARIKFSKMFRIDNPWLVVFAVLCGSLISGIQAANPTKYMIGGVLSTNETVQHFVQEIGSLRNNVNMLPPEITMEAATFVMNENPIQTALAVCERLIQHQVYAVIVSHPSKGDLSPAAVSYTCGFYYIPVIGISSRDSAFSDKNIHVSFLRTVPPYSHQADVWVDLLNRFMFRKVIFIHSADADGNGLLARFQNKVQNMPEEQQIKVEHVEEFLPGLTSSMSYLQALKEKQSRVYLLYASAEDAKVIFRDAKELNMTGSGYAWLITEQALDAPNVPNGVLAFRLVNASDEAAHIHDSVIILTEALKGMYDDNTSIEKAPVNCNSSGTTWATGKIFFSYIIRQKLLYGHTGNVHFDENGDRLGAEYEITNIADEKEVVVGRYVYAKTSKDMQLEVDDNEIVWPGNTKTKPEGFIIPSNLSVVTLIDSPFVWARQVNKDDHCNSEKNEISCPRYSSTNKEKTKYYCCYGYCMDLLKKLSEKINFTYTVRLGEDGKYGSSTKVNGTDKKEWDGLIGELVNDKADMIVAPLTINQERSQAVEFSKPFKYQGITILEKKHSKSSTLVSFLQPFQDTLWILVMVSVHVVALVLYLLDRFSPFGRFKLGNNDSTEEDALNLSSAIWFAWGVLLNSGIGEGTPRSFSARVLGMVWAGFAMIIVASYTANLAAFLVLERPETSLSGINDARAITASQRAVRASPTFVMADNMKNNVLWSGDYPIAQPNWTFARLSKGIILRNPMENFTYATVKHSAVDMYFRRQVELSNMYRTMEGNNYDTAEDAIAAVKAGKLKAFIWDSSRLEYEASQDCDLVTAGELFGRSGYGIALRKSSQWSELITLSILNFHENGFMEDLDDRWILQNSNEKCQHNEKAPATLGLKNMAGVFILVAAGIVGGVGLIIIEIIYKKQQIRKQKRMELARHAADKWRGIVEKRKTLRATLETQKRLRANGVGDTVAPEKLEPAQLVRFTKSVEFHPSSTTRVDPKAASGMANNPVYGGESGDVIV